MFSLFRLLIVSIRTVLNCLFFPFVIYMVILVSKLCYDIWGLFNKHTWELPQKVFYWFFQNHKAWDLKGVVNSSGLVTFWIYAAFVTLILISLSNALGIANLFIKFLRRNSGIRKTLNREEYYKDQIIYACDTLEKKYEEVYNKKVSLKVRVIDAEVKNAFIFSDNVVVLTTGLLDRASNYELKGIIAHEWGHMHNGDTLYNQLNFTNSVVSNNIEMGAIVGTILRIWSFLSSIPIVGIGFAIFGICFLGPFLLLFAIFGCLSWFLSFFEAIISQRQEYLADKFALSLDSGDGLLDFLYEDMQEQDNFKNIFSIGSMMEATIKSLYRSHPASHKRIKYLEKILNKQNIENVKKEHRESKWIN